MEGIRLGVIGCGNMATAILSAVLGDGMSGFLREKGIALRVTVSDTDAAKLDGVRRMGAETVLSNRQAVEGADYVLLAVKPQSFEQAVEGLDFKDSVVISIMAGVTVEKIARICGVSKVVRVMPNLNAAVGMSVSSYTYRGLTEAEDAFVYAFLSGFGSAVRMSEDMLSAATGVAGSGPAFVFMFIKGLIDAAKECGFSEGDALRLATQTVKGSAEMIAAAGAGADINAVIGSVCSKGGTTIEGVNSLRESAFEDIVKTAVFKAVKRAEELAKL